MATSMMKTHLFCAVFTACFPRFHPEIITFYEYQKTG
jgi:hypothetical protein